MNSGDLGQVETRPSSNLPLALNTFVGRADDMARVRQLLTGSRLVTLTGAPGIGKTRLALEVAEEAAPGYADGAWLVQLASVAEPALVAQAVAAALSVREQRGRPLIETLIGRLRAQRLLLVLDNCEHVILACAQLADAVLRSCPEVAVLATSQEALAIAGEAVWPVPPLSVPDAVSAASTEAVSRSGAVQLFCDRARATQPDFALTSKNAPAVVEICWRLDGIALAIELAAARADLLSPAQIAGRLDDRFGLLTGGSRSALPRQQTLRAALDWSHDLLSDPERLLFRRLSVFAGGFTLEAAEAVCAGDGLAAAEILDLLGRLVAKSLVMVDAAPAEVRYRLLGTVRAYGRNRLVEAGEGPAQRARHAGWCIRLAEAAEPELMGARQQGWLERLEAEHDNLRAALEWTLAEGDTEQVLRLAGALTLFWRMRSHFREGRERLAAATTLSVDAPSWLRAKALWGKGFLTAMLGGYGAVIPLLEESLALFEEVGDTQGRARTLLVLGNCWLFVQGRSAGLELLEQSVALAREAGDSWCLAQALALCGSGHNLQGDVAAGRPFLEESVAVAREAEDKHSLAFGLSALGYAALRTGDYGSAQTVLDEALAAARELDEGYETASLLTDLAQLALGRGEYDKAASLLDDALATARDTGSADAIVYPLEMRAELALAIADYRAAERLFRETMAVAGEAGGAVEPAVQGLGEVALAAGDHGAARTLLDQATALAEAAADRHRIARARSARGNLARAEGDEAQAASQHQESLALRVQVRDLPGIAVSLEALAGLGARAGRAEQAARLFGAARALRVEGGYARPPRYRPAYEQDLQAARAGLSEAEFDDAWERGAELTVEEAVSYASRGRGVRSRLSTGWDGLTRAEREVALLVAEGLTNRQIAERLFVSVETVKTHLARVFAKIGVTSRTQLAREVPRDTA